MVEHLQNDLLRAAGRDGHRDFTGMESLPVKTKPDSNDISSIPLPARLNEIQLGSKNIFAQWPAKPVMPDFSFS
jgi:hypothetical protein